MTTQFNLTINKDGEALSLTTTDPESLKRIMSLAGIDTAQAQVTPCGCGESLEEVEIEEASDRFANSVQGAGGAMRVVGDTVDFGLKGTGAGKPGSALRKPSGMGDNPLADEDLEEAKVPMIDENNLLKEYADYKVEEEKKSRNPYAIGMAQAMKSTGDEPPLKKSTIKKAHEIAKAIGEAHGIAIDEEDTNEGNEFSGALAKAKAAGAEEFEVDGKKYKVESVEQLAEAEDSPVASAIARRIMMQHTDVLAKHGPQKVLDAIDDVADFVGDVEEIGSSDVSGWVKQVIDSLGGVGEQVQQEGLDLNALKVLAGVTPTAKPQTAVNPQIAALKALAGI